MKKDNIQIMTKEEHEKINQHSCFCKSCVPSPACELKKVQQENKRITEQNRALQKELMRVSTFKLFLNGRTFGKRTFFEILDNWRRVKAENLKMERILIQIASREKLICVSGCRENCNVAPNCAIKLAKSALKPKELL